MKRILTLLLLSFILTTCKKDDDASSNASDKKTLILVSMDGFRHDYFDFAESPALDQIAAEGVKAEALIPVFPSKTFPNHYTQVTGLYPENHGITANNMWDGIFGEIFTLSNGGPSDGRWFGGEPVWITAEKQGLTTATFFWPGSEVEIKGTRPTHWKPFDSSIPYSTRTQQVLDWLALPVKERPDFITLYFESPDSEGHSGGPNEAAVSEAIKKVDDEIAGLLQGIEIMGLDTLVNIIVVSDHGMSQLSRDSIIFIDDYISMDDAVFINTSPVTDIYPNAGKEDEIYDALKDAHPKYGVYKKGEIPIELHYNDHRRIAPIVGIAEDGWSVTTHQIFDNNPNAFTGGTHGYHPKYESMWGILLARGPSFKNGVEVAPFESIDLYELMCEILDIGNHTRRKRWAERQEW